MLRKDLSGTAAIEESGGYQYCWAGSEEIQYINNHSEATSPTAYERRAQRGDSCLCLKKGDEIIGYHWMAWSSACIFCGFGKGSEIVFFPLREDQVFTYDLYVYKAHRRSGAATAFRGLLWEMLKQKGIREIYTLIDPDNRIALKLNLGLGYKPVHMVYQFRIRQWAHTRYGPLDKEIHEMLT